MVDSEKSRDFDRFGRNVWNWITEHELWKLQEFAEWMEIAENCGLAESVVFDPKVHEIDIEAGPGETFYAPTSSPPRRGNEQLEETVQPGQPTDSIIESVSEPVMVQ